MYKKNAYKKYDIKNLEELNILSDEYRSFLSKCKTERLVSEFAIKELENNGFKNIDKLDKISTGSKVYFINRNKNVFAFIIGKKNLTEGMRVLGAHIDSPRIDLKQNPLYEKEGFAYFDTHYYGGIKKYQWVTRPLALYGVVYKKDGTSIDIQIGDGKNDPVFGITDLLIHLAGNQMQKTADKVIEGENLDLNIGTIPLKGCEDNPIKSNILTLLKDKYDISEEDFVSSEIEVVPQGDAKEYGLDCSMITGYGHDDRSCAFTSLKALLDLKETPEYTTCVALVDKEEVGSIGATGAQSRFFINCLNELLLLTKEDSFNALDKVLTNSLMLSSDVSAAIDPLYEEVNEINNSCRFNEGIVFNKYTGSRGKGGCNDADPKFIAYLRDLMDQNEINYQTSELGKVDQGGGGTIAYILANLNMSVIDAGIPVLNMHAPMELVSKADLFEAYKAYKVFLLSK